MENLLQEVIIGNVGTVILVLILWRSGILKYLLNGRKERNFDDGQPMTTIQEVANTVAKLEQHFNNDTTTLLTEINQQLREHGQKLDKISDGVIYLKAKVKNGSQ